MHYRGVSRSFRGVCRIVRGSTPLCKGYAPVHEERPSVGRKLQCTTLIHGTVWFKENRFLNIFYITFFIHYFDLI